jgi:hypothetical protein
MQILYGTARGVGYTGPFGNARDLSGLFDPVTNIEYGTAYLAEQYRKAAGSEAGAASAYNGGWRPQYGFGLPATKTVTLCLVRDPAGNCLKTRTVQPGEYGNKPYVDAVLANLDYFRSLEQASTGVGQLNPQTPTGTINPKLVGLLVGLLFALIRFGSPSRKG